MAMPSAIEIAQPAVPRRSERRATRCSTSSIPAKKNRKTRPKLARKSMWVSILAQPSPSGPIRIPSRISMTTVGSKIRVLRRERIAPPLAAARTSTREPASSSGTGASAASVISPVTQGA